MFTNDVQNQRVNHLIQRGRSPLSVIFLISVLLAPSPVCAEGEGWPLRFYLGGITGKFQTPVMLGVDGGPLIQGTYQTPEQGYFLGAQLDIDRLMALELKIASIARNISYTQSNAIDSQTTLLETQALHVPLMIQFIPKRWILVGVGAYFDYTYSTNQPDTQLGLDSGISLSLGFDIPFGKNYGKVGANITLQHNISLYTYSNISPREYLLLWSFRMKSNKTPAFE